MRDGRTVKREVPGVSRSGFAVWRATLVVITGGGAGTEHTVAKTRLVLGRGPSVDLPFPDEEMSQQHAALEFTGEGFQIVDLGSTNGTRVNGEKIDVQELAHGDRLQIGRHVLQLVLEKRDVPPPTYVLEDA